MKNGKRIFSASVLWFVMMISAAFAETSPSETTSLQALNPEESSSTLPHEPFYPASTFTEASTFSLSEQTAQLILPPEEIEQLAVTEPPDNLSLRGNPTRNRFPGMSTAHQLQAGEISTSFRLRQFFEEGTAAEVGLAIQPTLGISWGISNDIELTLDVQTVDNGGPGQQGAFRAQRGSVEGNPNFFQEFTLQAKQRLWENETGTQALSSIAAISVGDRAYRFISRTPGQPSVDLGLSPFTQNPVFSAELPYSFNAQENLQVTLSPKVAFFPDDNALYFRRPPVEEPGSFGTTIGVSGAAVYQLNPRFSVWGDAFIPFTGNNTINVESGLPARSVVFNTGLRYVVNPRLSTDLFLSNALGNTGPLSMVAHQDSIALGIGLNYLPGFTAANRQYADSFTERVQPPPYLPAGFGFFDGGNVPDNRFLLHTQIGSQGLLSALRYGLLDDFEVSLFVDYLWDTRDESELGIAGKLRLMHQPDGDPFTLSALATFARANNALVNLISGNPNEFAERGLTRRGFALTNERGEEGELIIFTLSAPLHYQVNETVSSWLTPTVGYIQREGFALAGVTLGGSYALSPELVAIAEAGLEFGRQGNALVGSARTTAIPWTLGVRWNAAGLFGNQPLPGALSPQIEAYVSNRVGSSPFHSLRVRADNEIAVGVGLQFPF